MTSRRQFGQTLLSTAALLGLRTVSLRTVLGSGLLGACSEAEGAGSDAGTPDGGAPSGPTNPDAGLSDSAVDEAVADAGRPAVPKAPRVIVVGTGYGGAVTALRLTERGIPVTMIEMGRLWDTPAADGKIFCTPFNPDGRAAWFRDETINVIKRFGPISTSFPVPRQAGVLALRGNSEMEVYCGRGVGGGSLVNLSIYVEPLREVFQRTLPDVDAAEMFDVYYPRAKQTLKATRVPDAIANDAPGYQYSRVGAAAAKGAGIDVELCTSGYDYDYMAKEIRGEVPGSAMAGEAGYGNNYGKRSLDKTYIAEAMGTGLLTIMTLTEVLTITKAPDGDYVLACRRIDVDGNVLEEPELTCSHLFLAAGSMGTSEMLVRARDSGSLPDLNRDVGTGWGPNSDIFVGRSNPLWQPTGATQGSVPSMAFHTRDQDDRSVFSMIIPFPAGIETWLSLNIVMTENPEAGHFLYDPIADEVELKWRASQNEPAVKSTRFVFDKINKAAGTDYTPDLFGGPVISDRATYHPVGGCPLGRATDGYGRLRGYERLYVMDSSLIPVGIGANPALTVTALAERNVARILAEDLASG